MGRKNFFAKPLTSGIRRLKRELGSLGMSKQAIEARVRQVSMSPKEKHKAWVEKHLFVQGGLPALGRRRSREFNPPPRLVAESINKSQPHKQWKYILRSIPMQERRPEGPTKKLVFSGCECDACVTYYRLIARVNLERFRKLVGLDGMPPEVIRRAFSGAQ
jgi:hypothetical protein